MRPTASLHLDAGREFRGVQRQVLYLLEGLRSRGHRVLLCCPRVAPLYARAGKAGILCEPLTLRSGLDFPSAVRLARLVRDAGVDLVHAHDPQSHSIARAAQGIAHEHSLTANLFVTHHGVSADRGALGSPRFAGEGVHYIAISKRVRDSLVRLGVGAGRIAVVPSGVDVTTLAARHNNTEDPWGLAARKLKVVGTVGHFTREKNIALLLQAFALLRKTVSGVHLLLAGDGPMRGALEKRARELGIASQVTFTGHLDDVAPAFAALRVFALSSDLERLCTSVLDAMSAGVPVATTAAAGVLNIARHGVSALVVPPRDASALADSMARLLHQPDLAARLVQGAREVVNRRSVDCMVEATLEAYHGLGQFADAPGSSGTP